MREFGERDRWPVLRAAPEPRPVGGIPVRPSDPDPDARHVASYYHERAAEYDRIYQLPERQADLHRLQELVARWVTGRNVLELACGTGWWTQIMARSARSIAATDLNETVLDIAGRRDYGRTPVRFRYADAWNLAAIPGVFDTVFAGFWLSHLKRARIREFLESMDERLGRGGRVVLLDNRYVEGSSTPLSRTDDDGNSYQQRTLEDGRTFEVLKNFFPKRELMQVLDAPTRRVEVRELDYYWAAVYDCGTPG